METVKEIKLKNSKNKKKIFIYLNKKIIIFD
jgi:hypothetical protein